MDNFAFTGQKSGSGSNFFKVVKGIALYWAPVSILCETGIPFEGRVIDQSECWPISRVLNINSFNNSFLIIVFYQNLGRKLWNDSFYCKHDKLSISWAFASGLWTMAKFTPFHKLSCVVVVSTMAKFVEFCF